MKNIKRMVLLSGMTLIYTVMSGCSVDTKTPTSSSTNTPVSTTTTVSTTASESTSEVATIERIVYKNTKYNFTLKLPKSWEGKYDVKDDPVTPGNNISFINKATKYGVLFTISIWSKEYWNTNEEVIKGQIPISKIGEIGDKVYLFHTPTDVQVAPSEKKLTVDYNSMFKDIKTIIPTFEFGK